MFWAGESGANHMALYLNTEFTTGFPIVPPVWDDLRVPANATRVGSTAVPGLDVFLKNGAGTSTGVFLLWFDKSSVEQVHFGAQLPHAWKLGSTIHAHVHWVPKTNGGAGAKVSWGLEYTWVKIGGVYSPTTIISGNAHMPADASLVAGKHYLTELGTISGAGIDTVSSMLMCRLFRDATGALGTDDYDDDAGLLEVDFHIEFDSTGSRTEYAK